jgi:hypothetical protein
MEQLRSLCNALAPISFLPPEVLGRVFHFLSLEEPPFFGVQNLGWIRATHVCRFWRQVALVDSLLWARISGVPKNTELVSEMLARTRDAPLDIDMVLETTSNPKTLLMLSPHLSHTRKLRLHYLSMLHSDSIRDICSQEAPSLEHFRLGALFISPITYWKLGGTTPFFKGRAPRLRTFSLFNVFISWSQIPRGQITRLEISLLNDLSTFDIPSHENLYQLSDLLVNCSGLEVLILESCIPPPLAQFPHDQTVHLPRLSFLCLDGSSFRVTNLLRMLKLPFSTTLQLDCSSQNIFSHNDHILLPAVSAHLQGPVPVEFKTLRVTISYLDCWFEVNASTSRPSPGIRRSHDLESDMYDDEDFILTFRGLPEDGDWTGLIERVCKMLPISNLEFLSISVPGLVGPVNWTELFERCIKLTTIQAVGPGTSSLVRAFITPKAVNTGHGGKGKKRGRDNGDSTPAQPAGSTASDAQVPTFPKLAFLSLKALDFAENEHPSGVLFDIVQKGLRQRMVTNGALKMLRIDECAISPRRAKALEKLVWKFHWDGEESPLEEYEEYDVPSSWWGEFNDGAA